MKFISKFFSWFFAIVLILFIGISIIGRIGAMSNYGIPTVFGYQTMLVLTDSMEPTLEAGSSGIIVKKVSEEEIAIGDIITYEATWSKVNPITHRVVDIEIVDGEKHYFTMGDKKRLEIEEQKKSLSRADYDPSYTTIDRILGKVIIISGFLGSFISFTSSPIGYIVLIFIPLMIIFLLNIRDLWKEWKKKKEN